MYAIHGFDHGVEKPGVQDLFNLYEMNPIARS
jgi:hypothetical protein